jgi:hypothetical protein
MAIQAFNIFQGVFVIEVNSFIPGFIKRPDNMAGFTERRIFTGL